MTYKSQKLHPLEKELLSHWFIQHSVILCCAAMKVFLKCPLTHNEAVVSTITAVVQTAVGLEQEEAAGSVVIIGGDARHPQTFPLSQQLLLSREAPVMRAGLRSGVTGGHTTSQCWQSGVNVKESLFRAWNTNTTVRKHG